ncbi:hypothetical protein MTP99_006715 [Tenebrio molitor]|nr:hypothetical protein MTP99_006715 [Tenebrio molitor]
MYTFSMVREAMHSLGDVNYKITGTPSTSINSCDIFNWPKVPDVIVAFVVSWQKGLILFETQLSHRKDGLRRKNLRGFPNVFVLKLKEWHGLLRQILQTLLWRVSHQEAAQLLQSD